MSHDVFISYSNKDKTFADTVCAVLERQRIRCWIAPRDIVPGKEWGEAIIDAITTSRAMILIFSASANDSPQIRREVERAVSKEVVIVPFRIENVVPTKSLEYFIGSLHWLDAWSPPLEIHIEKLVGVVEGVLGSEGKARTIKLAPDVKAPAQAPTVPDSSVLPLAPPLPEVERQEKSQASNAAPTATEDTSSGSSAFRIGNIVHRTRHAFRPSKSLMVILSIIVLVAIVMRVTYLSLRVHQWSLFVQVLNQQPGIKVTSYRKEGGRYHVLGFRDPLAPDPAALLVKSGLSSDNVDFDLTPFNSADDAIILKRAKLALKPPPEAKLSIKDGVLYAEGTASPEWIAALQARGPLIAGVKTTDITRLQPTVPQGKPPDKARPRPAA